MKMVLERVLESNTEPDIRVPRRRQFCRDGHSGYKRYLHSHRLGLEWWDLRIYCLPLRPEYLARLYLSVNKWKRGILW